MGDSLRQKKELSEFEFEHSFCSVHVRMAALPSELYQNIFNHLQLDDLCALVTVSHGFQVEAEQIIHCQKEIRGCSYLWKQMPFLLVTPRLLPLICILLLEPDGATEVLLTPVRYSNLIASFLEKLPNLHTLHITNYHVSELSNGRYVSCEQLLARSTFQLHNLCCDFTLDLHLTAFLIQQPLITTLELGA
jgi:hypothetical protein